ncbi:MAG: hypothetical protein OEZ34_04465 [Spirochaetia bacterium]|nr:hypothetical protein [Spirochaetia bacterium]
MSEVKDNKKDFCFTALMIIPMMDRTGMIIIEREIRIKAINEKTLPNQKNAPSLGRALTTKATRPAQVICMMSIISADFPILSSVRIFSIGIDI